MESQDCQKVLENTELRLDRDAWVEQHHNRTKLIDELQDKLAAAEAALIKCSDKTRSVASIRQIATQAAIDAAKTDVKA